jgi:hypothetical protein
LFSLPKIFHIPRSPKWNLINYYDRYGRIMSYLICLFGLPHRPPRLEMCVVTLIIAAFVATSRRGQNK